EVLFGAAVATITGSSVRSISVKTPSQAAGLVDVAVTNADGTFTKKFAYTYFDPPAITSLAPNAGPASGGQSVRLTGTALTGVSAVNIGGASVTSFVVNS